VKSPAQTFLVSVFATALIWALSPLLIGLNEPWDTDGDFYVAALVIAGMIAGGLSPKPLWAHYLGAMVGQLGYELIFLHVGPLFLLGVIFLLGYALIYLIAAALGGYIRSRLTVPAARAASD
jgi:hypothetical protein